MDQIKFAKIIIGLAANFGVKIPEGLIELWKNAFQEDGISFEQINHAAGKIIRTKKNSYGRMPTYAEFLEIIHGGSAESKAQIIADEIIGHLRFFGANKPLVITDPVAKHLMSTRWPYQQWATTVLESDLKWWVKEFCEAYNAYSAIRVPTQIAAIPESVKKLIELEGF